MVVLQRACRRRPTTRGAGRPSPPCSDASVTSPRTPGARGTGSSARDGSPGSGSSRTETERPPRPSRRSASCRISIVFDRSERWPLLPADARPRRRHLQARMPRVSRRHPARGRGGSVPRSTLRSPATTSPMTQAGTLTSVAEVAGDGLGVVVGDDQDQADPHVEDAEHLGVGDAAERLEPGEDRRDVPRAALRGGSRSPRAGCAGGSRSGRRR